jgi:diaminopimelate decarboxylase
MLTLARSVERTPQRVRDIAALDASLSAVNAAAALGPLRVLPSISVKTDPSSEVVGRAIASGWLAETISPAEARFAASLGAKPETTVLNGPLAGPTTAALSRDLGAPIKAAFADSIEALDTLLASGSVVVPGYRVRPPSVESRFGVDVADFDTFTALITLLRRAERPYGVHFHYASDIVGPNRWFELLEEVIGWAATVAEVIGHGPTLFDIGGGWYHGDYYELFLPRLSEVQERIRNAFATVKELIIEPGKAVSATSAILVTEVVEVRDGGIEAEVVVDASIADLPMADLYAHPVFHMRQTQSLGWLGAGRGRLLGAICMETDVLARAVSFPSPPAVGDRLAFLNAGAYDASMAWPFASGEHRDGRPTL